MEKESVYNQEPQSELLDMYADKSARQEFLHTFQAEFEQADTAGRDFLTFRSYDLARLALVEYVFTRSQEAYTLLLDLSFEMQRVGTLAGDITLRSQGQVIADEMNKYAGIELRIVGGNGEFLDHFRQMNQAELLHRQVAFLRSISKYSKEMAFASGLMIGDKLVQSIRKIFQVTYSDKETSNRTRRQLNRDIVNLVRYVIGEYESTENPDLRKNATDFLYDVLFRIDRRVREDTAVGNKKVQGQRLRRRVERLLRRAGLTEVIDYVNNPVTTVAATSPQEVQTRVITIEEVLDKINQEKRTISISLEEYTEFRDAHRFYQYLQGRTASDPLFTAVCSSILEPYVGKPSPLVLEVTPTQLKFVQMFFNRIVLFIGRDWKDRSNGVPVNDPIPLENRYNDFKIFEARRSVRVGRIAA